MRWIFALLFLLLPALSLLGQLRENVLFSTEPSRDSAESDSTLDTLNRISVADAYEPLQLLVGRIAGAEIVEAGDDPNRRAFARLRSLSTLAGNSEPLFVLNGLPVEEYWAADPFFVQSARVNKGGLESATYGARGGGGVIAMDTRTNPATPLGKRFIFRNLTSMDRPVDLPPVASARTYLQTVENVINPRVARDNDFRHRTVWPEEITELGISTAHQLAYRDVRDTYHWSIGLGLRNRNGIGHGADGFRQINGQLGGAFDMLKGKVSVHGNVLWQKRWENRFPYAAFGHAYLFSPTAPIDLSTTRNGDIPPDLREAAEDQYGGYFQTERFGTFNPVAIVDQSSDRVRDHGYLGQLGANWKISDEWRLNIEYLRSNRNRERGEWVSREALFNGGAAGPADRRGAAAYSEFLTQRQLGRIELLGQGNWGVVKYRSRFGYDYQQNRLESSGLSGRGLPEGDFDSFSLLSTAEEVGNISVTGPEGGVDKFLGVNGGVELDWGRLGGGLLLRREGNSQLSEDRRWNTFGAVELSYGIGGRRSDGTAYPVRLRIGGTRTGFLPRNSADYLTRFGPNGLLFPISGVPVATVGVLRAPNSSLGPEIEDEVSLGVAWIPRPKLRVEATWYGARTRDLIGWIDYFSGVLPEAQFPANFPQLAIRSGGVELTTNWLVGSIKNGLTTRFTAGFYGSRLVERDGRTGPGLTNDEPDRLELENSGPRFEGQRDKRPTQLVIGERLGNLYTGQLDRRQSEERGTVIFRDRDGNPGIGPLDNRNLVGNGLPDWSLGLHQQLRLGDWFAGWTWRGQFGHQLINYPHSTFGVSGNVTTGRNLVIGERFLELPRGFPSLSDNDVENAGFLALDQLRVGKYFSLGQHGENGTLEVFVGGRDLIYLTAYGGNDPRARLIDGDGQGRYDHLISGMDRVLTYWRSRRFSVGVNWIL